MLTGILRWRNLFSYKDTTRDSGLTEALPRPGLEPQLVKAETVQRWQEAIANRATSPKDRFFVFFHIPKTAGITLALILSRNYEPSTLLHIPADDHDLARELKNANKLRERINAIAGHFHLNSPIYNLVPANYIHFTMLRDPIERAISFYYYIRNEPRHPSHEQSRKMSVRDFVHNGTLPETNNGQTRRLSHIGRRYSYRHCPPEVLEMAKQNLNECFTFFGLTEQFDTTLVVLRAMLSWDFPFYVKRNVTENKPKIDEIAAADVDCIIDYNQHDIELYSYAKDIFERRVRQIEPRLRAESQTFRSFNEDFQRQYHEFHNRLRELDHLYPWPDK